MSRSVGCLYLNQVAQGVVPLDAPHASETCGFLDSIPRACASQLWHLGATCLTYETSVRPWRDAVGTRRWLEHARGCSVPERNWR